MCSILKNCIRNYENVKKWILDCRDKESKKEEKKKQDVKSNFNFMIKQVQEVEEKLKTKEQIDLSELQSFVKTGIETIESQNKQIEALNDRIKNVTKAISIMKKEAFSSDGSSLSFFIVCGIVTLAVVLFLACICKETGGNMHHAKDKSKKAKVDDDLPPLHKPHHVDGLYDDESYISHHTDDLVKNRGKVE